MKAIDLRLSVISAGVSDARNLSGQMLLQKLIIFAIQRLFWMFLESKYSSICSAKAKLNFLQVVIILLLLLEENFGTWLAPAYRVENATHHGHHVWQVAKEPWNAGIGYHLFCVPPPHHGWAEKTRIPQTSNHKQQTLDGPHPNCSTIIVAKELIWAAVIFYLLWILPCQIIWPWVCGPWGPMSGYWAAIAPITLPKYNLQDLPEC